METLPVCSRMEALTGLRYCAAMTVILAHVASNEVVYDYDLLVGLSTVGMPLFFTLSGFLMCYNYYGDFAARRPGSLWRFVAARFARIYPAYLLALLLSFSFMGNFFHDLQDRPRETMRCLACVGTLTQSWFFRPVFVDSHNPRTIAQAYLGVAWSVSTEVFFYASFPLIVPVLKRLSRPRSILACATVIWLSYAAFDLWYLQGADDFWKVLNNNSKARWLLNYSPYGRIGEFWIGCLAGRLFGLMAHRPASALAARFGAMATWCCPAALLALTAQVDEHWVADRLHLNIGLAPLCGLLIFCLARYRSGLERLLASRPLVILGECSYSLFLLHPLIQSVYLPRTHGEDELTTWDIVTYNHLMMLIVLHLLALGFHQYWELPMRTNLRRWLSGRETPISPVPADAAPVVARAA